MAKIAAHNAALHWDEFDITGDLNTITLTVPQEVLATVALQDDGPRAIPGNYGWNLTYAGFGDYDDDAIDEITQTDLSSDDHYISFCPQGDDAVSNICYDGPVLNGTKAVTAAVGAAQALAMSADGDGGLSRSVVLWDAETAVTGLANGTGVNMGVTTSGQTFRVIVRVISETLTDLDIVIEESSDNGGADLYATIAGVTVSNLSTVGITVLTTTAATEAWKRVRISGFTGTTATVLITAGVVV